MPAAFPVAPPSYARKCRSNGTDGAVNGARRLPAGRCPCGSDARSRMCCSTARRTDALLARPRAARRRRLGARAQVGRHATPAGCWSRPPGTTETRRASAASSTTAGPASPPKRSRSAGAPSSACTAPGGGRSAAASAAPSSPSPSPASWPASAGPSPASSERPLSASAGRAAGHRPSREGIRDTAMSTRRPPAAGHARS
jgi:hypothetical protein